MIVWQRHVAGYPGNHVGWFPNAGMFFVSVPGTGVELADAALDGRADLGAFALVTGSIGETGPLLVVEAEGRVFTVSAEARLFDVEAEGRVFIAGHEDSVFAVAAEERTFSVR